MKAIVLSSGGVDSTTCLAMAVHELGKENVVTLSFEYGQRHSKELDSAQKVADYYGVRHVVFNLTQIFSFSNCSLLSNSTEKACGECGTCIDRKAAFEANGVKDPIDYLK